MSDTQEKLKEIFPFHKQIGKSLIINCDCIELMSHVNDKEFHLACVDPPYGINADKAQNAVAEQRLRANGKSKAGRGWKQYKTTEWDADVPNEEYFFHLKRVSESQIVWGANYMTQHLTPSMGWIVWNKCQREFSLADCELAWSSFNKAARIFDYSRAQALQDQRIHPTQKPIKLYEWLLTNYAKPGQRILDTHGGSMSSVIAANNLGFEIVCCELDQDYYKAACERVAKHAQQERLF